MSMFARIFLVSMRSVMARMVKMIAMTLNRYLLARKLLYENMNSELKVTTNMKAIGIKVNNGFTPIWYNQAVIANRAIAARS